MKIWKGKLKVGLCRLRGCGWGGGVGIIGGGGGGNPPPQKKKTLLIWGAKKGGGGPPNPPPQKKNLINRRGINGGGGWKIPLTFIYLFFFKIVRLFWFLSIQYKSNRYLESLRWWNFSQNLIGRGKGWEEGVWVGTRMFWLEKFWKVN